MTMTITLLDPRATQNCFGFIPSFLYEIDPRPAQEQFAERYQGGWRPMAGFVMENTTLHYRGDPPLHPIALLQFREERLFLYPHEWVAIVQPDGSFQVARMD